MTTSQHSPFIFADLDNAITALGDGPLQESALRTSIDPLFSRVLQRNAREIYLANHSLGRPLNRTNLDIQAAMDAWYHDIDDAWGFWMEGVQHFTDLVGQVLGVPVAENDTNTLWSRRHVVYKSSAGQGLRAVLQAMLQQKQGNQNITKDTSTSESNSQPLKVLMTAHEFDSIDVILRHWSASQKIALTVVADGVDPPAAPAFASSSLSLLARLREAIIGHDLVVFSHVLFADGRVIGSDDEVRDFIDYAHKHNCRVLVDVYHSFGVLPLDFTTMRADFVIGGCYKYARGGTGACFLYIREPQLLSSIDVGWFAKRAPFSYARPEPPQFADGSDAWMESTFAALPPFQALGGLHFLLAVGVSRLRAYSLQQKQFLSSLLSEKNIQHFGETEQFGAFIVVPHADPQWLSKQLKQHGVNTDARSAGVRFCPDVLTTTDEMQRAVAVLVAVLSAGLTAHR